MCNFGAFRTSLLHDHSGQVLTFAYVLLNDSGLYSCEAANRGGTFEGRLAVTVEAEDKLPKWGNLESEN